MIPYSQAYIFEEKFGNNLLSWEQRKARKNSTPKLTIPGLKEGTIPDVKIGTEIVFEEITGDTLHSCPWLEYFIKIPENTYIGIGETVIFDNHNHALFFWIDALNRGLLSKHATLIHIDEHSDLWENTNILDLERTKDNQKYLWEFTNFSCNVGNYIVPAIRSGIIGEMIRIENEYQIDENQGKQFWKNIILNIDLDFFSEELSHIDRRKKITFIQSLLPQADYITIATSPYFIPWEEALRALRDIFTEKSSLPRGGFR